jgi:hypothetical protein
MLIRGSQNFALVLLLFLAGVSAAEAQTPTDPTVTGPSGEVVRSTEIGGATFDHPPGSQVAPVVGISASASPAGVETVDDVDPLSGLRVDSEGIVTSPQGLAGISASSNGAVAAPQAARITIDRMDFGVTYTDTYNVATGLTLFGPARTYHLSDGTNWRSGAGSYQRTRAMFVSSTVSGNTIQYTFSPPVEGFVYKQTDYNSGNHSSNGSLGAFGPLVLEATLGSTTARMVGEVEILTNTPANYSEPRFNFFGAPVGSIAPFDVTFTLRNGATFTDTTFQSSFTVANSGTVDFTASRRPPLLSVEVIGSGQVLAGSTTPYQAVAVYQGGSRENVSAVATWAVSPGTVASISGGDLTAALAGCDGTTLMIEASFVSDGVTQTGTKDVICRAVNPGSAGEQWETYQGDAGHTGYVPVTLDPADFALRWQRDVTGGVALNPVTAADGKVFTSSLVRFTGGDAMFTLDARDGHELWSKDFGSPNSVNPPAYGYGNVYIQTGNHSSDTYLWSFDADTGALVFQAPHAAQWERYFAPTIYDGNVYVNGGTYGGMYAFDAFSGGSGWFAGLQQYDEWTPAVDAQHAYAYVGEYAPGLYVHDRGTGQLLFRIPDPNFQWRGWSMDLAPVLGSQNDVLAIHNGRLIKFDVAGQRIAWQLNASFSGQPSVAKGVIYAINGGSIDARDEANGALLWRWTPAAGVASEHVIVTDSHLFAHTGTETHAVDLASGLTEWSYPAAGHLALAEDTLYIAASTGVLTAIAMPAFSPSPPIRLEIGGPSEVAEFTTAAYTSTVYYADGRVRDRTRVTEWRATPGPATIDEDGTLAVPELLAPIEGVTIVATYIENGVLVADASEITLRIGVTKDAFISRNIQAAADAKRVALVALAEADVRERAAIEVAEDVSPRSDTLRDRWIALLRRLRLANLDGLMAYQKGAQSLEKIEGAVVPPLPDPNSPEESENEPEEPYMPSGFKLRF